MPEEFSSLLSNLLTNFCQIYQRSRGLRGRVLKKFHEEAWLDKAGRFLHLSHLRKPACRARTTLRAISDPTRPCSGAGLEARSPDMASTCHLVFSFQLWLLEPAAGREPQPMVRWGGRRVQGRRVLPPITKSRCNTLG